MATAPVTKAELLEGVEQQWQASEAALEEAAGRFDEPLADGDWTVGDAFRHIWDAASRTPAAVDILKTEGTIAGFDPDAANALTIPSLRPLSPGDLGPRLKAAHSNLRAKLESLSDDDLTRPVQLFGIDTTLGELLTMLTVGHEGGHVASAMQGASSSG